MKRPVIIAIVAVVLIAALGGGYWWWQQRQADADGRVQISGTVDADEVQISTLVGGRVTSARIAEGDEVERGQVAYAIDDRALKLQVDQAKAGVRSAKAAYDQAVDDGDSAADKAAAKARWDQALAAEQLARVQLSYATIKAPSAGTVTAVAATLGEIASPGRTLATIARTSSIFVRAFVSEPEIGKVRVGQAATLVTDSGDTVEAKVTFIASSAEFTPSNVETKDQRSKLVYEVRLKPTSAKGLTPGMPVDVTLE